MIIVMCEYVVLSLLLYIALLGIVIVSIYIVVYTMYIVHADTDTEGTHVGESCMLSTDSLCIHFTQGSHSHHTLLSLTRCSLWYSDCREKYKYIIIIIIHVLMRDERRKEERSKQGQTNNKAKQHSTPKAVTFPIHVLMR